MKQYNVQENVPISPCNRLLKFYTQECQDYTTVALTRADFPIACTKINDKRLEFLEMFKKNTQSICTLQWI